MQPEPEPEPEPEQPAVVTLMAALEASLAAVRRPDDPAPDPWHQLHQPYEAPKARRARRLAELAVEFPPDENCGQPNVDHPWLLVEAGVYDGGYGLTTHPTPEAAAEYHDGQEHPEDWRAVVLVDLNSGHRYPGFTEITFSTTWEGLP